MILGVLVPVLFLPYLSSIEIQTNAMTLTPHSTTHISSELICHSISWSDFLGPEKQKPYFQNVLRFVAGERLAGKRIYPTTENVFSAISLTPLHQVKVVILGQDPYHGPGQAHGLCFSVQEGARIPPSLQNIFKELSRDVAKPTPLHGDLSAWARQGVLLLNTVLTVEDGKPNSHASRGWEEFTDRIIEAVNTTCKHVVFLLWGSHAQKKAASLNVERHLILKSPHPSPLSAHRGFLGCRHFSKANAFLSEHGVLPVNW